MNKVLRGLSKTKLGLLNLLVTKDELSNPESEEKIITIAKYLSSVKDTDLTVLFEVLYTSFKSSSTVGSLLLSSKMLSPMERRDAFKEIYSIYKSGENAHFHLVTFSRFETIFQKFLSSGDKKETEMVLSCMENYFD